ncbi:MAG: hypothetical protein QNK37_11265 [Acidobacteriota bacterium]|nr:hypothetical protein [Acidobacteriota bacterium]
MRLFLFAAWFLMIGVGFNGMANVKLIEKKRQTVIDLVDTDISQLTVTERLEIANRITKIINELHDLVVETHRSGNMKGSDAAMLMDFVFTKLSLYQAAIGESEPAVMTLDYSARFYRDTSLEPSRYVHRIWHLRKQPKEIISVLEKYRGNKNFMTGFPLKVMGDAHLLIYLAQAYEKVSSLDHAAKAYDDYFDWVKGYLYEYREFLSHKGRIGKTVIKYTKSQALISSSYSMKELYAIKHDFEKIKKKVDMSFEKLDAMEQEDKRLNASIFEENFKKHIAALGYR